jgi:hypothetical protein
MSQVVNLIGQKFGRLKVISRLENDRHKKARWLCRCRCGNTTIVNSGDLNAGKTVSCGCYGSKLLGIATTTHGKSNTQTYKIWKTMHQRCYNPNNTKYKNYGARGIKVCKQWHSYDNFLAYMGEKPKGKSIERIDNDGNYSPYNCEWRSPRRQANNRRNNRLITFKGKTRTLAQWARSINVPWHTLYWRLENWSVNAALTR